MSTLKVAGNPAGGGDVTLRGPASAVTRTLTLPDITGTLAAQENSLGGTGQVWQNVSGSRVLGTGYTNDTNRTIIVKVYIAQTVVNALTAMDGFVDGLAIEKIQVAGSMAGGANFTMTLFVPPGKTYALIIVNGAGGATMAQWMEYR